jgi:hypothetical protein
MPVDAVWSLPMYEVARDGRLFFLENPIKHYAIGDRTKGLQKNPDSSIDVLLQHKAPGVNRSRIGCPPPRASSNSFCAATSRASMSSTIDTLFPESER